MYSKDVLFLEGVLLGNICNTGKTPL